jgi:hypothetical protein
VLPGDATVIAGSGHPGTGGAFPGLYAGGWRPWPPPACAMEKVDMELGPSVVMVGEAGQADAEKRARGCARPVRVVGSTNLVDRGTGEIRPGYSSDTEMDGIHAIRLIETAQDLAEHGGETYTRLLAHLASLGYRGHPITKSRGYSVTFGQIRRAKRLHRSRPAGLEPDADIRELLDDDDEIPDGFEIVSSWGFVGQGYLDLDAAADAVRSAALSRFRRASDLDARIGHHKEGNAMSWNLVEAYAVAAAVGLGHGSAALD